MKLRNLLTFGMASVAILATAQGYKDGIEYYRAEQYRNARTLLERNLNNPETNKAEANYYLGEIAIMYRDNAKAKAYFDAGIQQDPNFALNYVGLGELCLDQKDVKSAEKYFKQAEKLSGKADAASIRIAIARAYYNTDPTLYADKINKYVADAHKKNMKEPDIYLFEGDMEADNHNYGEAGGKYEMAIGYHPDTAEGYVKYAKLYDQVNPSYSIAKLEELVKLMPNSALGQRELALAYEKQGMYQKAAEQYGRYVKNPNHFAEDESQYSFLLYLNDEYQKGYDYATSLLKDNPNNFTAQRFQLINAAKLPQMQEQMLTLAENLYAKHKSDPQEYGLAPIDYTLTSRYFAEAKKFAEAEEVLNEAIQKVPNNSANFLDALTDVFLAQNQFDKAAETYAKYIDSQKEPKYSSIVQLARYYMYAASDMAKAGDAASADKYYTEALKNIDKAIAMDPEYYRGYVVKGDILIEQNPNNANTAAIEDYTKAAECIAAMDELTQSAINDARKTMGYLGSYYANKGDKANANKFFGMYLKVDPSDAAGYGKYIK